MAKATNKTVTVTSIDLELSREEAEAVLAVMSLIGGDRLCSRRRHTQAVFDALVGAGLSYDTSDLDRWSNIFRLSVAV